MVAIARALAKAKSCFVDFKEQLIFSNPVIDCTVDSLKLICNNLSSKDSLINLDAIYLDYSKEKNKLWLYKFEIDATNSLTLGFFNSTELSLEKYLIQHLIELAKISLTENQSIIEDENLNLARLSNNNKNYTNLLNQIPIGLLTVNAETQRIVSANSYFLKLFKFKSKEEITEKTVEESKLFSASTSQQLLELFLREGEVTNKPILCFKKNSELFWCLVSVQQIQLNNKKFFIYNFYDVTDIKNLESELDKARKIAEQSLEMQRLFLANVSHEIRTPINGILGFTELLQQTQLSNEQADYLSSIAISGKNLVSVVNDILDSTKIEAGLITLETIPFNINTVFFEIEKIYKKQAQVKHLNFELLVDKNLPIEVYGDPTRLIQIVSNLISNALKFTSKGGITVEAKLFQRNKEVIILQISVKDTGIGIEKDKLSSVFEKFVQEDVSTTRHFGGSGLGLSIVKKLIEIHKGNIEVTSEKNKGTEFVCYLPYSMQASANNNTSIIDTTVSFLKGKKILLAEDNEINQKLTSAILKREGAEVTVANNGNIALNLLQNITYDIILMDIQMPELDGISATKQIRNNLQINSPIIAMTANVLPGERAVCLKAGMNDYLSKPFTVNSLLTVLAKNLTLDSQDLLSNSINTKQTGLKHCNLSYLIDFSNGNTTFIKEMLELFLEQNPQDLLLLKNAAESKNKQSILAIFHKLKTSLGFIGFSKDLLDKIKLAETNSLTLEQILSLTNSIIIECKAAQNELKNELEKLTLLET